MCQSELNEVLAEKNSPSLPSNSVSSFLRNSALETVFRLFPSNLDAGFPGKGVSGTQSTVARVRLQPVLLS